LPYFRNIKRLTKEADVSDEQANGYAEHNRHPKLGAKALRPHRSCESGIDKSQEDQG